MTKQRHSESKQPVQGHAARKWWNWDLNPDLGLQCPVDHIMEEMRCFSVTGDRIKRMAWKEEDNVLNVKAEIGTKFL